MKLYNNVDNHLQTIWKCLLPTYFILKIEYGHSETLAYPGIFFRGGGDVSTNSVEDRGQREQGSGDCSPLVRGSGGSCNLVQKILFHIVKFS